jgi:hypothetical protein
VVGANPRKRPKLQEKGKVETSAFLTS